MKIDFDSLQVGEENFVEPDNVMMVEITKNPSSKVEDENMLDYIVKVKVVYLNAKEELIDLLNRCKRKRPEVMLCPQCSDVFDKEATNYL